MKDTSAQARDEWPVGCYTNYLFGYLASSTMCLFLVSVAKLAYHFFQSGEWWSRSFPYLHASIF